MQIFSKKDPFDSVEFIKRVKATKRTANAKKAQPQVASKPTPEPTPVSPVGNKLIADPIVETAVRENLKKPEGEITKAELAKVTRLNLGFTKITDEGLKDVAKLQQLEWLILINTKITDAGFKDVAKLQKLGELVLEKTQITDEGLKEVAKLQKLGELDLTSTKITDAGLKHVAKLKELKAFHLKGTKVTKAGVAELKKALPNCYIEGP